MKRIFVVSFLLGFLAVACSSPSTVAPSDTQPQSSIDILGMDKQDAIDVLEEADLVYRYCDLDEDASCAITSDLYPGRYTLEIKNGVVISYEIEEEAPYCPDWVKEDWSGLKGMTQAAAELVFSTEQVPEESIDFADAYDDEVPVGYVIEVVIDGTCLEHKKNPAKMMVVISLGSYPTSEGSGPSGSLPKVAYLDLLDMTKSDAIALLEDDNHNYRYCDLDEELYGCAMTEDFIIGRYTVYVRDGVVVFYEIEDNDGIPSFGERPF